MSKRRTSPKPALDDQPQLLAGSLRAAPSATAQRSRRASKEPEVPRVILEPMTEAQFIGFMEATFPSYVAERAAADHVSLEMAEQYARAQLARLLPDSRRTVGHRFLRVLSRDTGDGVGDVWFWIDDENRQGFLYSVVIRLEQRRRGFASAALTVVEEMVRAAGCISLGLNVFATNDAAIALYRKLGFCAVSSYWNKPL